MGDVSGSTRASCSPLSPSRENSNGSNCSCASMSAALQDSAHTHQTQQESHSYVIDIACPPHSPKVTVVGNAVEAASPRKASTPRTPKGDVTDVPQEYIEGDVIDVPEECIEAILRARARDGK